MRRKIKQKILAVTLVTLLIPCTFGCGKIKDYTTKVDTTEPTEQITPEENPYTAKPTGKAAAAEQESFDKYLNDVFLESVVQDTVTLHYSLAHPENYGITDYEITYGDNDFSTEAIEQEKKENIEELERLHSYDYELLTGDQKFLYDMLDSTLAVNSEFYNYLYLYEPFAYTSGLQANFPITMSEYSFYDEGDVKDYLALLEKTPDYIKPYLDFEYIKSEKGLFMNSHSAGEVIRQCSDFIESPEENVLIKTFDKRIDALEGLSTDTAAAYKKQNKDLVTGTIIPTYQSIIDTFEELKDTGKNDYGICNLESGKEYYSYLIKSKVGTDKTPEEIVTLLDSRIKTALKRLSKLATNNYDSYEQYFNDYESFYTDCDDNEETIRYFEDVFKEHFPSIPDINFTVTPVDKSLEDSVSPAFFMTPPMDAYTDNSIYINEGSENAGALWSTLAHEGIPGHMYQFAYFLSNDPEPIQTLLSFNGYSEGWAQYVENMSYKYYEGYADELYADFEEINSELNILISARVEIGVNYEGWKLEDTQAYLSENGFSESIAQDIIDYVVAEPANYQMYCVGWLEFEELREYAEKELGDSFDEIEFHKALLDAGPCQFTLLKKHVDIYIEQNK